MTRIYKSLLRATASVAVVVLVAASCRAIPHVDKLIPGLLLLVTVFGVATNWGFPEAVVSAIAASLALDYFFIVPFGFAIKSPEDWLALLVFLTVSIATSRLSTQANQRTLEAVQARRDLEKMYAFAQATLQSNSFEETVDKGLAKIVEIFGVGDVDFHFQADDRIFRAGKTRGILSEEKLREVTKSEIPATDAASGVTVIPLRVGTEMLGSLGVCGSPLSEAALRDVAQRFGIAVARSMVIADSARAEAARRSAELKSVLLDGLAHELKTPLTTIKVAASSMFSRRTTMPASAVELLQVIDEETTHLEEFVTNALQLARIDAGILNLEKGPHDVRGLIDSSLRDLNAVLKSRLVEIQLPADLPAAQFDFPVLKLVLKELMANAVKYSPPGSPLTISSRIDNDVIVVSLTDRGAGIDEESQTRIFEKFYRGQEEESKISGTGLGLAIAKRIVQENGGNIWVTSQPGKGATFSFSLPKVKERVS